MMQKIVVTKGIDQTSLGLERVSKQWNVIATAVLT